MIHFPLKKLNKSSIIPKKGKPHQITTIVTQFITFQFKSNKFLLSLISTQFSSQKSLSQSPSLCLSPSLFSEKSFAKSFHQISAQETARVAIILSFPILFLPLRWTVSDWLCEALRFWSGKTKLLHSSSPRNLGQSAKVILKTRFEEWFSCEVVMEREFVSPINEPFVGKR